ncbi:FAD-dependent monooxygenase family protein [Glycomyces tarimensis]
MSNRQATVIVVGAGPTGLLLAGDLAEAGVEVVILEKRGAELSNLSRAFGVHARTMEMLDARGITDDLLALGGSKLGRLRLFDHAHLHLSELDSRFNYLLVTPQYNVEEVLRERALNGGARIVYDAEVTGIDQSDDGVTAHTGAGDFAGRYLVGADGVGSAVRQAIGMPYPGEAVLRSIMLADVKFTDPPEDNPVVQGGLGTFCFIAGFGDEYWRIFAWNSADQKSDDEPVDLEEISEAAKRTFGTDFGMHDPRWISRFHSDERQVPSYRDGNVFLAGDAAHCHSPAGGQGMNTGLQDAANLSWKLVAVLNGAPAELLDTYNAERHPVGEEVLATSGALIRLAATRSRLKRTVGTNLAGVALRVKPIAHRAMGMISGIGIHYGRSHGDHRLVGHRAEDVELQDGTRLYERLRGGAFVVLDSAADDDRAAIAATAEPDGVTRVVRPDGYIGWAGDDDPDAIAAYLDAHAGRS